MMRFILLGTLVSIAALSAFGQSDSLELVKLYNSTEGDAWFTPWNLNQPMSTWKGVTLNDSGRVTAVSLNANNMKGALPNLFLPELLQLVLSNNLLRDTMPDLRHLRKLNFLDLSNNNLDGNLPNFNMPFLQTLRLANNRLSGQLQDYQNMPRLRSMILDDNNLNGGLPDFSNMRNLSNLRLANNRLDGPIPDFTNLPELITLDLHSNDFILTVPRFGGSPSLFILDLSDNQLTGPVPTFSRLALLETLKLNRNKFTGRVPNLGAMGDLSELDLSDNMLEGDLPRLTGNPEIIEFKASGNQFSGEIPNYQNLTQLQRLDVSRNNLSDTVPDLSHLSNLTELRIDSNQLTYTLFNVTASPNLEILEAQWNYFSFEDLFDFNGLGLTQFTYAPQRPIVMPDTVMAQLGDVVIFDLVEDQGVPNNTYSWYLNGEFRTAVAVNELTIANVNQLDTGIYHCIVQNNNLPALSLFSEEILLIVECPFNIVEITDTICMGDTLFVNDVAYFATGTYEDTVEVPSPGTCDSIFMIDLTVNEVYDTVLADTICESDQVMFAGEVITESGTYIDTLSSKNGCDSIVTLQLVVWPAFRSVQSVTICAGDTLFVGDLIRTKPAIYDDTLKTQHGCDSVIITDLEVLDAFVSIFDTTLCLGDSLTYRGVTYTRSGVFTESFTGANGCDSSFVLDLTIPTTDSFFINDIICSSDTVFVGDTFYTEDGNYVDTLISTYGCDSIVFLNLQVVDRFEEDIDLTLCDGDTLFFGGDTITIAGIYFDTLSARGGCDSIIKVLVNFEQFIPKLIDTLLCFGDSISIGNNTYKVEGFFRDTVGGEFCDTVIVTRIRIARPIQLEGAALKNANDNDGSIIPSLSGGSGELSYRWNTGDTTLGIDQLAPGQYRLSVFDTLGCNAQFDFEIEQTVASKAFDQPEIAVTIYPNPVEGQNPLVIQAKRIARAGRYRVELRNVFGQLLQHRNWDLFASGETLIFEQAPPASGFYFVSISDGAGRTMMKPFLVK